MREGHQIDHRLGDRVSGAKIREDLFRREGEKKIPFFVFLV